MPEYAEQVAKLCQLGATDVEIADFFEVSPRTIYRWKLRYEDFCQSIKSGKEFADERVERGLFQRATGYGYVEQQAFKVKTIKYDNGKKVLETEEIKIVEVEKQAPPDTPAGIFWLKNRRSDHWRDKIEHSGDPNNPLFPSKVEIAIVRPKT